MKLAIFALVALSGVVLADDLFNKEGYIYRHDERLGHFKHAPFVDLYKQYAAAFLKDRQVSLAVDDPERFRPSSSICQNFFITFANNDYTISDFDQFIVMDACLGYVMDGVYKGTDLSENLVEEFNSLAGKKELVALYSSKIDEFSDKDRTCMADLMLNVVLAKARFPGHTCNIDIIQLYIQFAECVEANTLQQHKDDPYVKVIFQLLRDRTQFCFDEELQHIREEVRRRFKSDAHVIDIFNRKDQESQRKERMWPKAISTLLAAVEGNPKGEISLRQVHQLVSAPNRNDHKMQKILFDNMAKYATSKIRPTVSTPESRGSFASRGLRKLSPKKRPSAQDNIDDPNGVERYRRLVDGLCNPFRISDTQERYDLTLAMTRLVQIMHHKELLGIGEEKLVEKLIKHTGEGGHVYLSVYACNLLSFTQGSFHVTRNGDPEYTVGFVANLRNMIRWPTVAYI